MTSSLSWFTVGNGRITLGARPTPEYLTKLRGQGVTHIATIQTSEENKPELKSDVAKACAKAAEFTCTATATANAAGYFYTLCAFTKGSQPAAPTTLFTASAATKPTNYPAASYNKPQR